jgi:hypothetical protein
LIMAGATCEADGAVDVIVLQEARAKLLKYLGA